MTPAMFRNRDPQAWTYEVATAKAGDGTLKGWWFRLSEKRPTDPPSYIRKLTPLYSDREYILAAQEADLLAEVVTVQLAEIKRLTAMLDLACNRYAEQTLEIIDLHMQIAMLRPVEKDTPA